MRENWLLLTAVVGVVCGHILSTAENLALKCFTVVFAFIFASACAFAYAEEKEINAELFDNRA